MKWLLLLAILVVSCASPETKVAETVRDTSRSNDSVPLQPLLRIDSEAGHALILGDVRLGLPSSVYLETPYSVQVFGDSVRVSIDIGSSIEDSLFTLDLPPGYAIKVFDRYRTSVVIEDEGPHWDLTAWKHYDTEWREIRLAKRNVEGDLEFRHPQYSDADWKRSPVYRRSELLAFLRSRNMADLAARLESPKKGDDIEANSSISSMYIKMIITKPDGSQCIRYVEFEIPMGC